MKRSWLVGIISFIVLFAGVRFAIADPLRVLTGPQGGTNIGTADPSDIGKALIVSSTSPLIWTLGASGPTSTLPYFPSVITNPTPITVTSSLAETNLMSFTISPNTLVDNRALIARVYLTTFQNNTSTVVYTFKVYYGASSAGSFSFTIPTAGGVRNFPEGYIDIQLVANGSVNAQKGQVVWAAQGQNSAGVIYLTSDLTSSADSTQSQPLRLTVQQSAFRGGNQNLTAGNSIVNLLSASAAGDVFATTTNVFSAPNYFTSSTFLSDPYAVPCLKFATSTGNPVWASICLQDQVTTVSTTPGMNLVRNGHFTVFTGPSTPDQWATGTIGTNFDMGGPATGGSATFRQTSTCATGSLCAENDTVNGSAAGDGWISGLSQSFTYDPTKEYTATFTFAGTNLQSGEGGPGVLACGLFSTAPISTFLNTGGVSPSGLLWNVGTNAWEAFTGFNDVGNAINCNLSTTTAFQDVPWQSAPVTGSAGTTTVFFNLLTINGGATSVPATFIFNNAGFGYPSVTQTTTTGTDQFVFRSVPNHPFTFLDNNAQFNQDVYVSSTLHASTTIANTVSTTQLIVTGNVTSGYVLGATDSAGTIGYLSPDTLGPWFATTLGNGFYLKNNKNACVGPLAHANCDSYNEAVVGDNVAAINQMTIGAIDPSGQNQSFTDVGPNGNGDASMLFTSANTSSISSIGADVGESGEGGRTFYFAKQNAFRAGYAMGNLWDVGNIGNGSAAFGIGTEASGYGSFAVGSSSKATNINTFAGAGGLADQPDAFAYGPNARAEAQDAIAMGFETSVTADRGVAIGTFAQARGRDCVALGSGTCAGDDSFAIFGNASNTQAIALGAGAFSNGQASVAFPFSSATGNTSVSMLGNQTNGDSSFGVGTGILNADHSYSFGSNMDVNGRFSHCISIGAFGVQDANCNTDYTFFVATDAINKGSIVLGGATSTPGGDTLVTINNTNNGSANALTVLGGNVGINTTTPHETLTVIGTGSFGDANSASGQDSFVTGFTNAASGLYSAIAGGLNNTATSDTCFIGAGRFNICAGVDGAVFGDGNTVSGLQGFAGGLSSQATGGHSFAFGDSAVASGFDSFALTQSLSSGTGAFSFAGDNQSTNDYSTSGGLETIASGYGSFAYGEGNAAGGEAAIALGGISNAANGLASAAFGHGMTVNGNYSVGYNLANNSIVSNANNVFTITGGNVGIGTTTPGSTLTVGGNIDATGYTCSGGTCPGATQWTTLPPFGEFDRNQVSIGTSNFFAQLLVQSNTSTLTTMELQATAGQTAPAFVMDDLPGFNYGTIKYDGSINFGPTTTASGDNSAAFGSSVTASGAQSVAFGLRNSATADNSAAWGGKDNETDALNSSISNGHDNHITSRGSSSLINNGFENTIDVDGCTIIGGGFNTCAGAGEFADVFGFGNYASGTRSFVIGRNNIVGGSDSFAAGNSLTVNGSNSFGFNLSTTTAETIDASNVFDILHANVGIGTTTPGYALTVAGDVQFTGTIHNGMATIASANNLALGTSKVNKITGVTQINCLSTTGNVAGDEKILETDSILTIKDEQSCSAGFAKIDLSGLLDFITTANANLTLFYNGSFWSETARTTF